MPPVVVSGIIVLPPTGLTELEDTRRWRQDIAGVPLLLRQARLLQACGIRDIVLLGRTPRDEALLETIRSGVLAVPGARLVLRSALETFEPAQVPDAASATGTVVLIAADWLFERASLADALSTQPTCSFAGFAQDGSRAGLAVATPMGLAEAIDWIGRAGTRAHEEYEPQCIHSLKASDLLGIADSAAQIAQIEERLWRGCRKPTDGIASRHLNRYISLAISRSIVRSAVSPNQISLINLALGLLAAALAAQGSYLPVLAGAALFQLNSIVDGVDGELARVRLQASVLGEWMDTLSDNIASLAFYGALGAGAWLQSGAPAWLWLTVITVLANLGVVLVYYMRLWQLGRGDFLAISWFRPPSEPGQRKISLKDRIIAFGTAVLRKDLFIVVLLFAALFGWAPYLLIIPCIGAMATLVAQLVVRP